MQLQTFAAQDSNGNVQTSPTVYIYALGTTNPISGLEDENGDALTNPFTGGADGRIVVAAPTGIYDMRVVKGAFDSTQVVQFIDLDAQVAAATAQVGLATTQANNAASSASAAAGSAAAAAEIVNISQVQTFTNPLRQAVRVAMTDAASGSSGIRSLDNASLNMGTNSFTLHWEGALPDYTPSSRVRLFYKLLSSVGYQLALEANGRLRIFLNAGTFDSTVSTGITDGSNAKITAVIVRESVSADGSITFYVNGVQLGAAVSIPAAAPATSTNAEAFAINGFASGARYASDLTNAIIYNRALSAAEVLSLCVNGPALADLNASQVPVYTSDFSAGVDGFTFSGDVTATANVDGVLGEDDWLRLVLTSGTGSVRATRSSVFSASSKNSSLTVRVGNDTVSTIYLGYSSAATALGVTYPFFAIPAGTIVEHTFSEVAATTALNLVGVNSSGVYVNTLTSTYYIKNVVSKQTGITGQWNAQDAQSDTGQIFDSSGNKNHAMLPATGATIIGKEMSVPKQVRWTNTWAGTNELQYIGGVNQAILPAKAYIESIVGVVTGATPHDIIIGDGSDTDRYVTITTGLAAGTTTFTLANRTTDGTNLKLTVDPDTNCTMSIAWTITYRTLE